MADASEIDDDTKGDDTLQKATKKYKKAVGAWTDIFERAREDLWFISDRPYAQWDQEQASDRINVGRPTLQIDQLGQFIHQVVNDIRMNTPTIKVIPDGDGSDVETAEIFEGLIKAIEYNSNADAAYDTAVDFSVKSSIGFIRVDHDYTATTGFEQELLIKRVINPQSILFDPDSIEPDGSDGKFAFVLEDISLEQFRETYPDKNPISFGDENPSKAIKDQDKITIAEYFCIEEEAKTIGQMANGSIEEVKKGRKYKTQRSITKRTVLRYKLSGQDVLEETTFPGIYVPVVPVYGEEAWIEGVRGLYSLIRKSKGAQRMYNLWKSLETELLLKQQQAPVQAAVGQMEGFEDDWKKSDKAMVLYYHQKDANGDPAPPPQRLQPPTIPTGIVNAARETVDDIKATMGIYNASLGMKSNETSGVAINQRQKEGDVATFHFGDNLNRSISHVGKICVFAIPEVYDTPRVLKIVGQEDEIKMIAVNGAQPAEDQKRAFDLTQGRFNVRVVTGPSFTTQRQEAAAQYTQLIQAMPDLMPVIGDLVFKYQDTPGAQAISARLKKTIDPKFLDEETSPEAAQVQQLQGQLQQITQAAQQEIQQLNQQLADKQGDMQLKAGELQLKSEELAMKKEDQNIKVMEIQTKAQLEDKKLDIEQLKVVQDGAAMAQSAANTQPSVEISPEQQAEQEAEQEAEQQQRIEEEQMELLRNEQALEIGQAILQQLSQLTDATLQQAANTAQLTNTIAQPMKVLRDENGMLMGAA